MNNKKGFTLIELLVTLAVLAILTTSITLSMIGVLNNQEDKQDDQHVGDVEEAACVFVDLEDKCTDKTKICEITLNDLISEGYISEDYNDYLGSDTKIEVTWVDGEKKCEIGE